MEFLAVLLICMCHAASIFFCQQFLLTSYGKQLHVYLAEVDQQLVSSKFFCQTCACMQATFGEQLLEVQRVDQIDTSAFVESVNSHLDMLRPAIQGYGGSVEVLAVGGGICEVKYEGSAPISMSIQAAIKDKFPDIRVVELLEALV